MPDERESAEVYPLAEFLCEEFQARGWTTSDVAKRMTNGQGYLRNKLTLDLLMVVHKDGLLVGDKMFAGLSVALGVSETMLRNLDAVWRKYPDRRSVFECPESVLGADVTFVFPDAGPAQPST